MQKQKMSYEEYNTIYLRIMSEINKRICDKVMEFADADIIQSWLQHQHGAVILFRWWLTRR